jgi:hypothetical protein
MKRCPQCDSVFEDLYRFCDLDGTSLIEDESPGSTDDHKPTQNWKILAMGAVAGLAIGVVLFVIYHGLTRQLQPESLQTTANTNLGQELPPVTLRAETITLASPTPELSPSPSPSPSPSAPTPLPSPTIELSFSPITTADTAGTRVRIRLQNGATIEADEAWKGPEGIWYRHRGVVALLDPAQVKSIERPTPSTSPSPSSSATPELPRLQD